MRNPEKIAVSVGLALALSTGVVAYSELSAAPTDNTNVGAARNSTADVKYVVSRERVDIDSAATLEGYADHVVSGTFGKITETGLASDYGLGTPENPNDPPVSLWKFHVDHVFKGGALEDILVVRYAEDQVESDEEPLASGLRAVAFLSGKINGAHVVTGGDQGLLRRVGDDRLLPMSPKVETLPDASTVKSLAEVTDQ